jgi:hypothetical protein
VGAVRKKMNKRKQSGNGNERERYMIVEAK